MNTVLVVVIAGVIIAAIAGATLSGDPKPPTTPRRRRRDPAGAHLRPAAAVVDEPPPRAVVDHGDAAVGGAGLGEPDERGWWQRLRAAGLLGVTVVVLGGATAAIVGVAVLLAYRVLDRALG